MKPSFQGEVMLAGWQESHTAGAKITFWLPDAELLEPFKGMTAKKGNTAGQRFMAVLVEIGDDDQPIAPAEQTKAKGGELARLAGMWCNDPLFREWLASIETGYVLRTPEDIASVIRLMCGVESRAELDNNEDAEEKFHRLIRIPYAHWLKERNA